MHSSPPCPSWLKPSWAKTSEERFLNTIQVGQGVKKDIVVCKLQYNYSSSQWM